MSDDNVPQQPKHDRQVWKQTFVTLADLAIATSVAGEHDRALYYADEIGRAAARLVTTVVGNARRGGSSWAQIGTGLGMTKQAAWEKWRHVDDEPRMPLQGGRQLAVVVTLARPVVHKDGSEFGVDLLHYLKQSAWSWVDSVARDLRVDHYLNLMKETGEDYWVRVAPYDWITERIPGLADWLASSNVADIPLVRAECQFALVLGNVAQMDDLRRELTEQRAVQ